MTDLQQLLNSPIPEVVSAAQHAIEFRNHLEANLITKSEFDDLIDDLVNLDKIDHAMMKENIFLGIAKAYKVILALKTLSSII